MTHVCAWCGRGFIGTSIRYHNHIICPECAIEEAYNQGWNDARAEVRRRVGRLGKEWGGAPRIPVRVTESPQEASEPQGEGYCSGEQD